MFKTLSVIGLGYIGLPTATMFAARKIHVHGVDVNQKIVDTINAGEVHIIEPDLDIAVRTSVEQGFLKDHAMQNLLMYLLLQYLLHLKMVLSLIFLI